MGEGMIGINNKYIYKGRTLGVWQTQSDLKFGIVSAERFGWSPHNYKWIKNKELGRYEDPHKAQAALDAFARAHGLEEA